MHAELAAIDSHVHVWTPDLVSYPIAAGYTVERMQPPSFTPEEYLAIASPLGVQRSVLIQMDFYGYDNSYLLDTLQRFPGLFSGMAQVDEHGSDPAAELRRLKAFGIRGLRIVPPERGDATWLDGRGMQALWRSSADERIAICPLIDPDDLPALVRMCKCFPETPVVVDHFAGIGSDGNFREADLRAICDLAQLPQTHVKVSAFYYFGEKRPPYDKLTPMIRRLVDAFGPQRLMWGSDSPFQLAPPNTYKASLEYVRSRLDFLSADQKEWLLQRTAAKVFFS